MPKSVKIKLMTFKLTTQKNVGKHFLDYTGQTNFNEIPLHLKIYMYLKS